MNVYIVASARDADAVRTLVEYLAAHGIDATFDASPEPGGADPVAVSRAFLDGSDLVLALWTPHSVTSAQVVRQATMAHERGILIHVADGVEPDALPEVAHGQRLLPHEPAAILGAIQARVGESEGAAAIDGELEQVELSVVVGMAEPAPVRRKQRAAAPLPQAAPEVHARSEDDSAAPAPGAGDAASEPEPEPAAPAASVPAPAPPARADAPAPPPEPKPPVAAPVDCAVTTPRYLAKGFAGTVLVQLYAADGLIMAAERAGQFKEQDGGSTDARPAGEMAPGTRLRIAIELPGITFSAPSEQTFDGTYLEAAFVARATDDVAEGVHQGLVRVDLVDEDRSLSFPVRIQVTGYAVGHISSPLLRRAVSVFFTLTGAIGGLLNLTENEILKRILDNEQVGQLVDDLTEQLQAFGASDWFQPVVLGVCALLVLGGVAYWYATNRRYRAPVVRQGPHER